MKIRMKVDMSGTRNGSPWPARGEVTEDIPAAEAAHLVSCGIAEEVADAPKPVETAVQPPAETSKTPEPEKPAKPAAETRTPTRGRPRKQA
jgi:hypothetical protein